MSTLLLSKKDIDHILTMPLALQAVKKAYRMYYNKTIDQPPIMSIDIKDHQGELDVKSCYAKDNETISIKTASGYWRNPKVHNLPTMLANITLYDARSGYPVCLMDGSLITAYRTGAAGGLSIELLARKDSEVIGVIGAGGQARMQVLAALEVIDLKQVKVYASNYDQMVKYKEDMSGNGLEIILCEDAEQAIRNSDIIITTTPSTKAIVKSQWVSKGTHIVAVGADMAGKQELDEKLFKGASIYVDSMSQCLERGETRNAILNEVIHTSDIKGELSSLLCGNLSGRLNDEITIFDTTGMGVQDNTLAYDLYHKAKTLNLGQYYNFRGE